PQGELLSTIDLTNQTSIETVYLGQHPVASIQSSLKNPKLEQIWHILTDILGKPIATAQQDFNGEIADIEPINRLPFGQLPIEQSQLQGLADQLKTNTGLYYNWHRDYDPSLGRYIQSDLIRLNGG